MKRWLLAAFCGAATVCGQTSGRVTVRITGEGARPLRGEVMAVTAGGAVRMNSVLADEAGAAAIDVPAGRALLVARAEGYVSEERQVLVRAGAENAAVRFMLAPAGTVSGRVFDETGAGVAGARVWLDYRGENRAWRLAEEAGGEAADPFGYFTLPVVAQGRPFVLHAETEGRLPSSSGTLMLRAPEMTGVVLLVSRRGSTVRGRVVDAAGAPVAGAALRLRAIPAAGEFTAEQRASLVFARGTNKTALSGADGSFSFAAVPAGRVVVTAQAGNRRASAEAAAAAGRETVLTLALR